MLLLLTIQKIRIPEQSNKLFPRTKLFIIFRSKLATFLLWCIILQAQMANSQFVTNVMDAPVKISCKCTGPCTTFLESEIYKKRQKEQLWAQTILG